MFIARACKYMPTKLHNKMRKASALAALVTLLVIVLVLMVASTVAASRTASATARQKADRAATSARSGAELLLYALRQLDDSNSIAAGTSTSVLAESLKEEMSDLEINGVSFIVDRDKIHISSVILDAGSRQSFTAMITYDGHRDITADVTGLAADTIRIVRLKYDLGTGHSLIFDPAAKL